MSIFQYGGGGGSAAADMILLNYLAAADLMGGVSLDPGVPADIVPNQSFSVDPGAAFIECIVSGIVRCGGLNAGGRLLVQIVIDSASASIVVPCSANIGPEAAANYRNALAGSSPVAISGIASGAHTIKARVQSSVANAAYCQPVSLSPWEWLRIQVIERF